jgi:hypothetical protein
MDRIRLGALAALILLIAAPSNAGTIKGPQNLCVTAQASQKAKVTAQACNPNDINQQWDYVGQDYEFRRILASGDGLCMDVEGGQGLKKPVIVYGCNRMKNQQWELKEHYIKARSSQFCFNLPAFNAGQQFNIDLCNGSANQAWRYQLWRDGPH